MKKILAVLIVISIYTGMGCAGYQVLGAGKNAPRINLMVTIFKNSTREQGLDKMITSRLKNALIKKSGFNIVNEKSGNEISVTGNLLKISEEPILLGDNEKAQRYKLTIKSQIAVSGGGKVISDELYLLSADYQTSGNILADLTAREHAISEISNSMADTIAGFIITETRIDKANLVIAP